MVAADLQHGHLDVLTDVNPFAVATGEDEHQPTDSRVAASAGAVVANVASSGQVLSLRMS